MSFTRSLVAGAIAGATGTMALDLTTYVDMAYRGRGPSSLPATIVEKLVERTGIGPAGDEEADGNRRSAIGSLLGYANGIGVGALYGAMRGLGAQTAVPFATLAIGGAAMALSDVPAAALGASDPSTWSAPDWISDIVPHAIYGLVVALTYDAVA